MSSLRVPGAGSVRKEAAGLESLAAAAENHLGSVEVAAVWLQATDAALGEEAAPRRAANSVKDFPMRLDVAVVSLLEVHCDRPASRRHHDRDDRIRGRVPHVGNQVPGRRHPGLLRLVMVGDGFPPGRAQCKRPHLSESSATA